VTSKIWVCDDEPSDRYPVWTRGNVGEVFSEAASPLTWTVYGRGAFEPGWRDAFCAMGVFAPHDFASAARPEILACFGGYLYINMSVTRVMAVRIPGLTVEAMDRSLFGDYRDAPAYRPDPRDTNAERTAAAAAWLQSLFTEDPRPIVDEAQKRVDAMLAGRPDPASLSEAELLAYFRGRTSELRQVFKQHVLATYGANVLVSLIAQTATSSPAKSSSQ
jgi:hypothetical protein